MVVVVEVGVDTVVVDGEDQVVVVDMEVMVDTVEVDMADLVEDMDMVADVEEDMVVVGIEVVGVVVDLGVAVDGTTIEDAVIVAALSLKRSPLTNKKQLHKMAELLALKITSTLLMALEQAASGKATNLILRIITDTYWINLY
ncbi:hypothetical protein Tco_1182876 [Tanacetum coccineum]